MGTFLGGYSGKNVVNSLNIAPTKKIDFSNFLGINWTGKSDKKALENDLNYNKGSGYKLPTTGNTFLGGYFGTDTANDQAIRRSAANTLNKEYNTIGNNSNPVEKQSGLNYYNDPYQINSILDVFNRSVLRHNYNIDTVDTYWSAFWKGLGKAWQNNRVKGKPFQTVFNNLMAIGEDMDILENPIKALTAPAISKGVAQMDYQDALEIVSYWQNKEEYNRENAVAQATEYVNQQLAEQGLSVNAINPNEYQRAINDVANQLVEQWDKAAPTYDAVSGLYTFTTQNGNVWRFTEKEYHNIVEDIVNSGRTVNPYALRAWKRLDAATFAFGTDYGHLNYNYQTGSTLADIALEIVSDPENWVTFGASALASGAQEAITKSGKGLLKHADLLDAVNKIDNIVVDPAKNNAVKQTVVAFFNNNKNIQRINRQALDYARDGVIKATSTEDKLFLHELTKQALGANKLSNTFNVTYDQAVKYTLWKTFKGMKNVDLSSAEIYKLLGTISISSPNKMTNTILETLKPLNKVKEGIDNTQKALLKAQLPVIGGTTLAANLVRRSPEASKWVAKEIDKVQHCFIKPGADVMSSESFDDVRHIIDEFVTINKAAGIDIDGDALHKSVVDIAKSGEVYKLRNLINMFDTDSKLNFITAVDKYVKDTYHDYENWTELFAALDKPSKVYEQLNTLYTMAKDTPSISMAEKQKQTLGNMLEALRNGDFFYVKSQLHNVDDDPVLSNFFKAFDNEANDDAATAWLDMLVGEEKNLKTNTPAMPAPIIKYLPELEDDSDALDKLIQAYFDYDAAKLAGQPYAFNNPYIEKYIVRVYANQCKELNTLLDAAYTIDAGASPQTLRINKLLEAMDSATKESESFRLRTNLSEAVNVAIEKDDLSGLTQVFDDLRTDLNSALDAGKIVDDGMYSAYAKVLDGVQDVQEVVFYLDTRTSEETFESFVKYLNTVGDNDAGITRYENIIRLLNVLESEDISFNNTPIPMLRNIMSDIADPYEKISIGALETTIQLKVEASTALYQLMQDKSTQAIQDAITSPNSALHKYLSSIGKNDVKYSEAQEILHMFDSTDAVRDLYRALDKPGMREDVSAAVKQAIQRVYGKAARDVLVNPTTTEKFLKDIIDSANTTLREVSKEVKSYSVEELYNTLMASKHPNWVWKAETHLSESDIEMQHALIELLPDVQKLRDEHGYTLLTIDWETANEQTNSIANVMLNWAGMTDNGKSNKKLYRPIVEKYFPSYSYLQNSFKGTRDTWVTAMSDKGAQTAAMSEDDLIVSFYKYLTEQYNESGQKLCVLGHNSNRFDLTLLENKINNNPGLRLKIAAENADPDILSKCSVIDTLQEIQRIDAEKGMFSIINESEEANIRAALLDYLSTMSGNHITTNRMFSLLNASEMRTLNGFLSDMLNDIKYVGADKDVQAMLTKIKIVQENIGQYFEALNDIRTTNMALNNNPILLSAFKEPTEHLTEIRAYITDVLKAKYPNMSDPEIEVLINSKFGKNLELATPTKITALEGLAFKYQKDIDTMYDFLDAVKVKAAGLSDAELSDLSSLCRKLDRHKSHINIKLIADNYKAIYNMVESVIGDEPIGALLNERMAPANLGALFYHYYYRAVWASGIKSTNGFSAGYIKRLEKMAANLNLLYNTIPEEDVIAALNMFGVGIYDWNTLCSNGIISETLMWAGIRHDLNTNLIDLPEYSRQLEHLGVAAADAQAKYAVLRPVAELAAKVKTYWGTLTTGATDGGKVVDSEQIIASYKALADDIKQKTFDNFNTRPAEYFVSLKQDDKINWLAHSGGLCIVPGNRTEKQAASTIIGTFYNAEHDCTIYYLTKEANYRIMRDDDTVRYFVQDVEYEAAPWINKVDSGINTQPINGIDIQPHLDTLTFHTNGNSCLSTMSTLNNEQYSSFIQLLPKEVIDNFTQPHEFWVLGNMMNHTDYSGKYVPMASDMYVRTINATSNVVQNHNSINNYIAAFMQKGSELKNTELGKLFMSSPLEARQYLKEHPEFVLAACVPDAKSKVGYTIIKYHPDNVETAIENGAYLFEDYVVDRMISAVNQGVFENNKIINFIQKIERLYKVGYLIARPATSMRNFMDTIVKTRGETGEGYISILNNYAQALHETRKFKETMSQVYELRNENVPLSYWLKSDAVKEVCKNSGVSYDWFIDMYRIMQESSINGEISVIAKATAKQRQAVLDDALSKGAVTKTYRLKHSARQSFNTMCSTMLNDMGQVEQVARLAQYNILKERGATIAERFKSIKHAQFNYEVKSPFVQKAELFMPFFNFQANNMVWWYDTFANNFWLINELSNILGPALDLGQYNPETLDDPDNIFTSRNTTLDNILEGNIPINDNTYLVTGNSLFDLLGWVDPLRKMHDSAFSPVMDLIDYLIDIAILPGSSAKVSEWLFENFGHDLNEAAVQKRFEDWANNYMQYREDYEHQHSLAALRAGDVSFDDWIHSNYYKFSYIPVVGTLLGNMVNAGYYLADGELNKALSASKLLPTKVAQMERDDVKDKASHIKLYYQLAHLLDRNIAGVRDQYLAACKALNIDPNCNLYALDFSTIQDILQHMQASLGDSELSLFDALYTQHSDNAELAYIMAVDDDSRYLYSRLKYALGYGDTKLSECPEEVQRVLYHYISDGFVPHDFELNITSEDLQTFWNASLKKYNVADVPYDKIPTPIVNKMFEDVTKSCITVTQIIDAFDNVPGAGYAFAQVRDSLGLKGLKLNQWPAEYLEVALNAIVSGKYNQYHWSRNKSSYIPRQQKYTKQYHRKTYAHKYYSKYSEKLDRHGMYLNYSHDPKIYEKQFINYSKHKFGTLNKIQSAVYQGMSPSVLSQIRKDLKYKFY